MTNAVLYIYIFNIHEKVTRNRNKSEFDFVWLLICGSYFISGSYHHLQDLQNDIVTYIFCSFLIYIYTCISKHQLLCNVQFFSQSHRHLKQLHDTFVSKTIANAHDCFSHIFTIKTCKDTKPTIILIVWPCIVFFS